MRIDWHDARDLLAGARVARLATASPDAVPHLVPITFALLDGDVLAFAVDHKPKRGTNLRRLRNIAANPAVSVLADGYADDWDELWWARADGTATIHTSETDRDPISQALSSKYPQYDRHPPSGTVVRISVNKWSGWKARPS